MIYRFIDFWTTFRTIAFVFIEKYLVFISSKVSQKYVKQRVCG
jgi:hypothetical protein